MKLLIEAETPGAENLHAQEPALETEIAAFVKALVKSRTRGPEPRVTVVYFDEQIMFVPADQLLRLQKKATALECLVKCDERDIASHLQHAMNLIKE